MARADLDKQPNDVRRMFDAVAKRYDVTNDVLSLGQDRRWRTEVLDAVAPRSGELVLDLAAGTGTSSQPFADAGATVVPCDFSLGMLRVGKGHRPHLPFTAGDGTRLLALLIIVFTSGFGFPYALVLVKRWVWDNTDYQALWRGAAEPEPA